MALHQNNNLPKNDLANNDLRLPSASRRSFLGLSAAASAAFALRIVTEPMLAHARVHSFPKDAIRIDANENPLGPSSAAREAAADMVAQGAAIPTTSPTISPTCWRIEG